ncbi:C39 family peptidase [Candidatus Woesearchaeota archaeon]|nr:C39 family peptidase [Candidatus Woesearchaeota archaeon]
MTFQFYKQETKYTCGAAAMRMALEFFGIRRSEKQLAKLLGTNKVSGTWYKDLGAVAEKFELNYISMRNSTFKDLKEYQKKGFIIIILYFSPKNKIAHLSVLRKIDSKNIYFWDPWFGPEHKYGLKYFEKIWRCDPRYGSEKRWFFAMKKP